MSLVIFGQPDNGIVQTAYVVKDIREAIDHWVKELHVGPWFLIEHFKGLDAKYRGKPSEADAALAMSFAGHMNIELIQQYDDAPSVYRETIDKRGYGFHHWGVASSDVDADIRRYEAMGMEVAFRAGVPTGGDVAYMDTHGAMPGFLELIATNPAMDRAFSRFYGAALSWDGTDPVRPFM